MKNLLLISMLIIFSNNVFSQSNKNERQNIYGHSTKDNYLVLAGNVGYTFNINSVTGALQLGYRIKDFYISANMIVKVTQNALAPIIFPFNVGYNIKGLQPFISYGFQTIGIEAETRFKNTKDEFINGWRVGGGVSYYFRQFPLSITIQQQGKQQNLSVGIYKAF
jgi:hypothetical protein